MATIQDINSGAQYRGDANLGGSSFGSFELDVKPVQQLAQYTYLYNRSEYEQRQKNADEAIQELAKLTAYNLNNAVGKDKEAGIQVMADIEKYGAEFAAQPLPKTPAEKVRQKMEYQAKIQGSLDKINLLNARGLGYMTQKNEIAKDLTLTAAQKDIKFKELDRLINETDGLIPALPKFEAAAPTYGKAKEKVVDALIQTPNGNIKQTITLFDPATNRNESLLEMAEFNIPPLSANATDNERLEYQNKLAQLSKTPIGGWLKAAQFYNEALNDPKYSQVVAAPLNGVESSVPVIDIEKIKAANPLIGGVLTLVQRHNDYIKTIKENGGTFTDQLGNKVQLAQTFRPEDYQEIIVEDGLTPDELIYLGKFSEASPDKKVLNFDYTGASDKLRLEQLQQAGANYRAKLNEDGANFRATLGGAGKNDPTVLDEAVVYTNTLFERIEKATNPDGTVDLTKAKLTPKDYQMMGKGVLDATGKFNITEEVPAGSKIKFDKTTNTITVTPPKEGDVQPPDVNINFQQIGNNKYDFNKATTAGAEDKTRIQLTKGYQRNAAAGSEYEVSGKGYSTQELLDLGYTAEQIAQAVKLGNIKKNK